MSDLASRSSVAHLCIEKIVYASAETSNATDRPWACRWQMTAEDVRADVISYFEFYPSNALSITALCLFTVVSLTVFAMTIKTRQWFMVIATIVGLLEAAGYACRIYMTKKPVFGAFVCMQCFLIISPSFLALVQYITLGKVVRLVQQRFPDRRLLVKPKLVIWGFFVIEIIALTCQGAGAGLSVNSDGVNQNAQSGRALLIVGLVALVVLIGCYGITSVYVARSPLYAIKDSYNLRRLFPALFACTGLLLIRNIFRLVEFCQGFYGGIAKHEGYFYGFDALVVFLHLVVNTFLHFGVNLKAYPNELKEDVPPATIEIV